MYTYALSLPPAPRSTNPRTGNKGYPNGWTHPIPLQYHPMATRRLMRTGMPTAERPAKRTHGSQGSRILHDLNKGRGPHRRPQPVSATQPDSVCLAKSRRAASRFSRQKGGSHPLTRLPTNHPPNRSCRSCPRSPGLSWVIRAKPFGKWKPREDLDGSC